MWDKRKPGGSNECAPFVSAWSEVDLYLQAGSPGVDAGGAEGAPSEDAEGRPGGGAIAIGAHER